MIGLKLGHGPRCLLAIRAGLLAAVFMLAAPSLYAASADIEQVLLKRITEAQKNLTATERRVTQEREQLAKQLFLLEREVLALREKTAVARRLADEKTLSIGQLQQRLDSWQQQRNYQQSLLRRFLQNHGDASANKINADIADQIAAVVASSQHLGQRFSPAWASAQLVLGDGKIVTKSSLAVGPITWYWDESVQRIGLASKAQGASGKLQSDMLLASADSERMASLRSAASGDLVFDPTLNRALVRQQQSESVWQHIGKGGLWAAPILLFGLLALSIALIKVLQLWRLSPVLRFTPGALAGLLAGVVSERSATVAGMQKTLLAIAQQSTSPRQRDDELFMQLQDDKHALERWIGAIAVTAAVSPLLGLLGTVSGMIETFKMMTLFGSGDPEVVSGGIAQALITTELGLIVAIPALVLHALLSRRAKAYYNELESFAILLSKSDEPYVEMIASEPSPQVKAPARKKVSEEVAL
ncbi:MotA/TolQ/ExbB proton channel family protein [Simiduia curdlanivorans]|uniref:MotA/TolQ/ExbB proton channel family protein n=1 Tax=Simiduia curdlanivorans TaxID=1492769 RepID=A0ABV8V1T2_9GAMM|nr:MotA/TolQ/ExbB proton channel family protein [Simiduia curdlanivorans]MDN3637479.1 MotA/TolQ/ExbB proton channel family protein [Simiduia curdlanivorans]